MYHKSIKLIVKSILQAHMLKRIINTSAFQDFEAKQANVSLCKLIKHIATGKQETYLLLDRFDGFNQMRREEVKNEGCSTVVRYTYEHFRLPGRFHFEYIDPEVEKNPLLRNSEEYRPIVQQHSDYQRQFEQLLTEKPPGDWITIQIDQATSCTHGDFVDNHVCEGLRRYELSVQHMTGGSFYFRSNVLNCSEQSNKTQSTTYSESFQIGYPTVNADGSYDDHSKEFVDTLLNYMNKVRNSHWLVKWYHAIQLVKVAQKARQTYENYNRL